jgi:hypothetical protein
MCDKHYFVFEFDKAYNHQLIEKFEASPEHPLTPDVAQPLKGVYALYHRGQLVYAGKALGTGLHDRLRQHYRKIAGRQNIDVSDISCRFLTMDDTWFVRAAEDALIEHYSPPWNGSGIGSHAPGGGRPGIYTSAWDAQYPQKKK